MNNLPSDIDLKVPARGAKGDKGNDGKTPVRGVDYWTDVDKQAIKDDVTKTVGDAFAKAKADVEDLIVNRKY